MLDESNSETTYEYLMVSEKLQILFISSILISKRLYYNYNYERTYLSVSPEQEFNVILSCWYFDE